MAFESPWDGPSGNGVPDHSWFERPEFRAAMARGIAAANAREATLESPAAEQAVEASREQFRGIGRGEALELATSAFDDLMSDERDGLQLRAGERVTGFRSPTVAVVEDDDGEQSLILGSDPLAVRDDGRLRRLDLTLTGTAEGFAPERPAVALEIPEVASEFVTVGQHEIGVRSAGAGTVAGTVAEDRVFFPSVAADTDFVVAPTRAGAQVMWQLRSVDAPQELGVDLALPDGASVRLASPITTPGGQAASGDAEIVKDGIVVSTISAPVALDANGSGVPASFLLRDGKLVVAVPHRDEDVRYPLMVDPEVRDVWGTAEFAANCGGGPANFAPGRWSYGQYGNAFTPICGQEWAGSGNGLYIRSEGGMYYNGAVAQWAWPAPQGSYIISTWFDGLRHGVAGSHLFTGLYGSGAWGSITNHYQEIVWADWTETPDSPYRSWGAYFGLFMDGTYPRTNWGWAGVRGVNIRLGDLGAPTVRLTSLSTGLNSEAIPKAPWINDARTPITVTATANDWGLGLQDVGVERAGGGWYGGPHLTCAGHRASPCPRDWAPTFNLNQLPEGYNQVHTWSRDIIDQIGIGAPWIQRIDRSAPSIQLTGALIEHAQDGMLPALPQLYVHVVDGAAGASDTRSGVKRVRLYYDGLLQQDNLNAAAECDSCSRGQTWERSAAAIYGEVVVRVDAEDYVGNRSSVSFPVKHWPTSRQFGGANGVLDSYGEVRSLVSDMSRGTDSDRVNQWTGLDSTSRGYYVNSLLNDAQQSRWSFNLTTAESTVRSVFADPTTHAYIDTLGTPMTPAERTRISGDGPPGPVDDAPIASSSQTPDQAPLPGEMDGLAGGADSTTGSGCDPGTDSTCAPVRVESDQNGPRASSPVPAPRAVASGGSWFNRIGARDDANAHAAPGTARDGTLFSRFAPDCTNFVSQVWHMGGGLNMTDKWFIRNMYGERRYTASWTLVQNFVHYVRFTRRIANLIRATPGSARLPAGTGLGDVVQYDWGTGDGWSHLAVVVNLSGSYDRISQHSNDRLNSTWRRGWFTETNPSVRANMRTRVVHVMVR